MQWSCTIPLFVDNNEVRWDGDIQLHFDGNYKCGVEDVVMGCVNSADGAGRNAPMASAAGNTTAAKMSAEVNAMAERVARLNNAHQFLRQVYRGIPEVLFIGKLRRVSLVLPETFSLIPLECELS